MAKVVRQPVQMERSAFEKLLRLKKQTRIALGRLCEIGVDLLEKAFERGEIAVENGVLVRREAALAGRPAKK